VTTRDLTFPRSAARYKISMNLSPQQFGLRCWVWLAHRIWLLGVAITRMILRPGPRIWAALDRLGIAGFGVDLVRLDFPPDLSVAGDWQPAARLLEPILSRDRPIQLACLDACLSHAADLHAWPGSADPAHPEAPWLHNEFLTEFDMALLYGMLLHKRPDRYVEIGSGISTRVAGFARRAGLPDLQIVSVDPQPRVDVARICNEVYRRRLEEDVAAVLAKLTPRSVLFFDGSHRSFPGSDVTVFFLTLLPRLPPGVLVHIHDIYLPADYPATLRSRLWSEQYLLAAWLLGGGANISVQLPAALLAQDRQALEILRSRLSPAAAAAGFPASSFWFRVTD
jgi:hypothetical protein